MYEETFPVYPSRGLWFTACPLHDLVDYLHAWPLFRLPCEVVWAHAIPLVTLWYLGWWDEERQISYRVVCAGKGRVERQILRTARGREACQLHTRHQTAPSGSPWQITGVWSSRGTVPATWLMFEGKRTLSLPCARIHTQTAVEMDWLPIAWWQVHRTRAEFTPTDGLFQPKMRIYPPSFYSKHIWFYISLLLWKIAGIMLLKVQAGLKLWTRNQFLRYYLEVKI